MKQLSSIGLVEQVFLPSEGAIVPAKIDTGADSSAIWANSIKESSHNLEFTLFDKKSSYYSGKIYKTDNYSVVSVKNSFGGTETRYKVYLSVTIAGRKIKGKFTLADRSKNRHPVLIGRKTISGKFLIDASSKPVKEIKKVLMLTTKYNQTIDQFAKNIHARNRLIEVTYLTYNDLTFRLNGENSKISVSNLGLDIASFDLVFFKSGARYMDIMAAIAKYLEKKGTAYIPKTVTDFAGTSKLYQYFSLLTVELNIPASVFLLPDQMARSFAVIKKELGLPFILKDIHGIKGNHNYLINDKKTFNQAVEQAKSADKQLIAQKFIANDEDYRVLIFGTKIALVIKRSRSSSKTHLNNTSKGAKSSVVPTNTLPPIVQKASLEAAKLLRRDVAGVDILKDKNSGVWYCLEVNNDPQLSSGSSTEAKADTFTAYLERKLFKN